jgi:hypothetical protein
MTSAEKKIILDKGSDYRLQLYIKSDDGIGDRDLTGWGWVMTIFAKDDPTIAVSTLSATFDGNFSGDDLVNGRCTVHVDSTVTAGLPTGIETTAYPFLTEYSYYYTLTVTGSELPGSLDPTRQMRVMRGKLAVRE